MLTRLVLLSLIGLVAPVASGHGAGTTPHWVPSSTSYASADDPQEPALELVSPKEMTIWPDPKDLGEKATISFRVNISGEYMVWIASSKTGEDAYDESFGRLVARPEPYTFVWNGRMRDKTLAKERLYYVNVYGWPDVEVSDEDASLDTFINVKRGTGIAHRWDDIYERHAGKNDVAGFTLSNSRKALWVDFDFLKLKTKYPHWHAVAAVDVNKAKRGYLIGASRGRSGKIKPFIQFAWLASDQGTPKKVKCPSMRLRIKKAKNLVRIYVPRTCIKKGGRRARANWYVGYQHSKNRWPYDGVRGDYFGAWTSYKVPPSR